MHRALHAILLVALVACATAPDDTSDPGWGDFDPFAQPGSYTVRRGDTLVRIAKAHGVTVAELRAWNGVEGDLIEVDQILVIWRSTAASHTARGPRPGRPMARLAPATVVVDVAPAPPLYGPRLVRSAGVLGAVDEDPALAATSPVGMTTAAVRAPRLTAPSPKRCLAGDEAIVAGAGLSERQIRAALDPFVHHTSACIPPGSTGGLVLTTEITVGCDGRVSRVDVTSSGGAPAPVSACIAETLSQAGFPAHDLPDGQTFGYPITYRF